MHAPCLGPVWPVFIPRVRWTSSRASSRRPRPLVATAQRACGWDCPKDLQVGKSEKATDVATNSKATETVSHRLPSG